LRSTCHLGGSRNVLLVLALLAASPAVALYSEGLAAKLDPDKIRELERCARTVAAVVRLAMTVAAFVRLATIRLVLALPIHDDVRFGAWAALGDFGRTGSFGFFHRVTTDTFANALEG